MSVITEDFERRWAVWLERGRRHDAIIRRRMLWFVGALGTGLAALAAWMLLR